MHVKLVYPALIEMGYLKRVKTGYFDRQAGSGQREIFTLTDKLLHYFSFDEKELTESAHLFDELIVSTELYSDPEPIKISKRDTWTKVQSVSVPKPSKKATSIKHRLTAINTRLTNHWIDLDLSNSQWKEIGQGWTDKGGVFHTFNFTKRRLYRVFHDDRLQTGGRFYGGWWQEIPSHFRHYIVIDNIPTIECDFSGLHPSILYAESGHPIPQDPYSPIAGEDHRDTIKRCFNAMLNAKRTMTQAPKGVDLGPTGLSWPKVIERIMDHHAPIKSHFFTGAGLWLMKKDSDLAEQVMLLFVMRRKACLPVHDSFIVQEGDENQLLQDMTETFTEQYGVKPEIKINKASQTSIARPASGRHIRRHQFFKKDAWLTS